MDLFDLGKFFSSYVPIKALDSALLRHSAAAIAAKQLGRINAADITVATKESADLGRSGWAYKAAKHYDRAIACLREALTEVSSTGQGAFGSDSPVILQRTRDSATRSSAYTERHKLTNSQAHRARSDDLLAATSILSVYEFLDDSNVEWSR